MSDREPWSVTQLLSRLKFAVESEVGEARVVGEIGSCKVAGSGHVYFTLKDETAQLACVLYRYQAASCRVQLREGVRVELSGRATVWEGRFNSLSITCVRQESVPCSSNLKLSSVSWSPRACSPPLVSVHCRAIR